VDVYAFFIDGSDLTGSSAGLKTLAMYAHPIATVEDIVRSNGRLLA
jgi:hypothetical protein